MIKAQKVSAVSDTVENIAYPEPFRGSISAYVLVSAQGFHGMRTHKRVRIGVEFGVTPETARDMMKSIREDNRDINSNRLPDISGKFVMEM